MYAVFKEGGKQYRVSPGDTLRIERLPQATGENVEFHEVLLVGDEEKIIVDENNLKNTSITARVVESGLARKIIVFKKKRRKGYSRKYGHRQSYTTVCIENIRTGKELTV